MISFLVYILLKSLFFFLFTTRIFEFFSFLLFKYFIGFFFPTTKSVLLATTQKHKYTKIRPVVSTPRSPPTLIPPRGQC